MEELELGNLEAVEHVLMLASQNVTIYAEFAPARAEFVFGQEYLQHSAGMLNFATFVCALLLALPLLRILQS